MTASPSIFEYVDYRAYLRDWFAARKQARPGYSHRVFARQAGYRSSGVLLGVTSGKRNLTEEGVEAFAAAMKLGRVERAHFRALVAFAQASTDAERNEAWQAISAERRFRRARRLDAESVALLSRWYWSAVHQLVGRADFRRDPKWIAENLRPRIRPEQAAEAVDGLLALGLLVERDGALRAADVSVVVPDEVALLAAANYHREMSLRAHDAVTDVVPEERHMLGVTVAVPAHLLARLKDELDHFQARLLDLCDSAEGPKDAVYQLNLQLVPLSTRRPEST